MQEKSVKVEEKSVYVTVTREKKNHIRPFFSFFIVLNSTGLQPTSEKNKEERHGQEKRTQKRERTQKDAEGSNKKLLGAPGIATRSKDVSRGSWPYYR